MKPTPAVAALLACIAITSCGGGESDQLVDGRSNEEVFLMWLEDRDIPMKGISSELALNTARAVCEDLENGTSTEDLVRTTAQGMDGIWTLQNAADFVTGAHKSLCPDA